MTLQTLLLKWELRELRSWDRRGQDSFSQHSKHYKTLCPIVGFLHFQPVYPRGQDSSWPIYLNHIYNGAISSRWQYFNSSVCLSLTFTPLQLSKWNQPWWGWQKEIRSRDQGYAQRGGDWFTVHTVSDIIGVGNTVAWADELKKKKKVWQSVQREADWIGRGIILQNSN